MKFVTNTVPKKIEFLNQFISLIEKNVLKHSFIPIYGSNKGKLKKNASEWKIMDSNLLSPFSIFFRLFCASRFDTESKLR